jgi:hypothetical protein
MYAAVLHRVTCQYLWVEFFGLVPVRVTGGGEAAVTVADWACLEAPSTPGPPGRCA